jgi:co-chaperonin GroES (HSP10)
MKSIYDFIVEPIGERYNNNIKIGKKNLIVNTKIESWKFVNNIAKVVSVPLAYKTNIKIGDTVVIHHNVFRRFYDIRGKQKDSRSFFKDNLYFCAIDQIYLYKRDKDWNSFGERCFVAPVKNKDQFSLQKEQNLIGILKYGNSSLNELKIAPGDLVGYTPNSEYDFVIDNERLYCMKSNDIVIKYEYKGNEIKYNPSWAESS